MTIILCPHVLFLDKGRFDSDLFVAHAAVLGRRVDLVRETFDEVAVEAAWAECGGCKMRQRRLEIWQSAGVCGLEGQGQV